MATLKKQYREKIVPELQKKLGYKSAMEVPKLTKITLNMGLSEAVTDKKIINHAMDDLAKISGQKPVPTLARKSIAGFKIRDGWPIGCKVTLRGERMYEFLERLIVIAIPRIRDFRGFSGKAFDKNGNYSLGVKEQIIFPEIEYDKIDAIRGLDITLTINTKSTEAARALLTAFNFPLRD
ncbi:MAG TPA: 50S ribosomal protein L5 [Coxiellaceae bacterium]|nr:50S ribosomal protein L5 [Coxiellaceae bacterium]